MNGVLDFDLPAALEASGPPEERGLGRDAVRLLVAQERGPVSDRGVAPRLEHRHFTDLPGVLEAGDVLVVNTSATLPAALAVRTAGGEPGELHLSTQLPGRLWTVELRHAAAAGSASTPWLDAAPGTELTLPDGGCCTLLVPASPGSADGVRLWMATLDLPAESARVGFVPGGPVPAGVVPAGPVPAGGLADSRRRLLAYLARHGKPIRYGYVTHDRPIGAYQTVFADEPGSAEMPSAARPFSAELVTRLVARGVAFAPFVLHTGVSSLEAHEPPFAEWYRLGPESAQLINAARAHGHRVIAVGTTAVRTIETVVSDNGRVHPGSGWTELVVTPERGVRGVDGLITGWHEPQASHLAMLEAVAGRPLLEASYRAALDEGYLWHEFGDSHLILR